MGKSIRQRCQEHRDRGEKTMRNVPAHPVLYLCGGTVRVFLNDCHTVDLIDDEDFESLCLQYEHMDAICEWWRKINEETKDEGNT